MPALSIPTLTFVTTASTPFITPGQFHTAVSLAVPPLPTLEIITPNTTTTGSKLQAADYIPADHASTKTINRRDPPWYCQAFSGIIPECDGDLQALDIGLARPLPTPLMILEQLNFALATISESEGGNLVISVSEKRVKAIKEREDSWYCDMVRELIPSYKEAPTRTIKLYGRGHDDQGDGGLSVDPEEVGLAILVNPAGMIREREDAFADGITPFASSSPQLDTAETVPYPADKILPAKRLHRTNPGLSRKLEKRGATGATILPDTGYMPKSKCGDCGSEWRSTGHMGIMEEVCLCE